MLLALVVVLATAVEAALGFGGTVLVIGLGVHLLPIDSLLAVYLPINLVLSLAILAKGARRVDWRVLLTLVLPAMVLAFPLGILLGRYADPGIARVILGGFLMVLAVRQLLFPLTGSPPGHVASISYLLGAGAMHGAFASGGPLVVVALSRLPLDKDSFRATLAALWLVLNSLLVAEMSWRGEIHLTSLTTSAALALAMLLGLALGQFLHTRVPSVVFRKLVWCTLLVAGAALLGRGWGLS